MAALSQSLQNPLIFKAFIKVINVMNIGNTQHTQGKAL